MSRNGTPLIMWSLGLWAIWTLLTWWFEGRIGTLQRPDAVLDRLIYTILANILVGVVGTAFLLWYLLGGDTLRRARIGFGPLRRSAIWVPVGAALGLGFYFG
ncbi:MAG: hypothetical protein MUF63_00660 [Rhodobacteraceae bacterium]|jgi:hypothetical protein|nr:hypothetical protein [Paracoccaceae bacterium]